MDTINSVIANFDSIVNYMAKCINDKFVKIQKACRSLNPDGRYYVKFLNKDDACIFLADLYYLDSTKKWYTSFSYEDTCCSNELPCKNYKDSIIGMTAGEIKKYFSETRIAIVIDDNYTIVNTIKL